MDPRSPKSAPLKEKAVQEFREYLNISVFLAALLIVLTTYRRLVMAQYGLPHEQYGIAIIEALVLGKVILIGKALRFGERFHDRPLILSVLYKSAAFGALAVSFAILEHIIRGLVQGKTPGGALRTLLENERFELLGRLLLLFVVFVPFFAFRELERVTGAGKLHALFFRRREERPS